MLGRTLLDSLELPKGIKELDSSGLSQLAAELRAELIETVALSGGHLSSNLGAAELTLALHYVFNPPIDRLVWDIGHQAYLHKMLTGRRNGMQAIRTLGGISGFLKRHESPYDSFGAGHAGTSISAALGMSLATEDELEDSYSIAIIGDASIASGMAWEALNHAGEVQQERFVVVLNDNEMSIGAPIGALSRACSSNSLKKTKRIQKTPGSTNKAQEFFEALDYRYLGPVDGHDLDALIGVLAEAKKARGPVLVHAKTKKGKGFAPAEKNPSSWHGVGPFSRNASACSPISPRRKTPSYTEVFGNCLCQIASRNSRVVGITAGMASGTGLEYFRRHFPDSFFDVGICEQHAVTLAAGMACEGYRPVCAIYSSFLQRAYDQIIHDVALQKLPVVFAIDRAGAVGNDGDTHQGAFDISFLRTVPGIVLMSPKDENELRHMLYTAITHDGPVAIRYPRGEGTGVALDRKLKALPIGCAELLCEGADGLLLCLGPMCQKALQIRKRLREDAGIEIAVLNARYAKPLDRILLEKLLPRYPFVATLEDHSLNGGFSSSVLECINDHQISLASGITRFGIRDSFVPHASQSEQHSLHGYDTESIVRYILRNSSVRLLQASA